MNNASETNTENIFREFYGPMVFIEKNAIPRSYGFLSKRDTNKPGYPDFFRDDPSRSYAIVVEAKGLKHSEAEAEVKWYMNKNNIDGPLVGVAISGQKLNQLKVTYYYQASRTDSIEQLQVKDKLLTLDSIDLTINKKIRGETVSEEELVIVLKQLNEKFHNDKRVRSTDRSLFFSGLLIALSNNNFRNSYKNILAPTAQEMASVNASVLEAHYLNESILSAITTQLNSKINSLSKQFSWQDKFSFIRNVDYSLLEYKEIINIIEKKVYLPFSHEEKQDVLGKAYKIFLSRSGKAEDKNIILTPDHIKELMVKLARLSIDDVVLDTCMGSGGFLMESMEIMINMAKDDETKIEEIKTEQLIGFEVDSVLFALACSNMFLHGDGRSKLLFRSSLLDSDNNGKLINSTDEILLDFIKESKPTKCIINPPYEHNNPIDFTLQAIDYLEPNGKLIIIMPTPTLNMNKDGKADELLNKAKLDFVIKMPYNLFSEQKRIVNTSIFGFTKTKHLPEDEVLFVNLKDDGFESIQHKGRVDVKNKWNDIENKILNIVNGFNEEEGVSQKKKIFIRDSAESENYSLVPNGVSESDDQANLIKIKEIFDIDKGLLKKQKLQSSKNDEWGEYDFVTAADGWKKHSTFTHDCEALVYATKAAGSLGKSQYVNGKFIPSDLVVVLTKKEDTPYEINLQFYNEYFNSIREKVYDDLANGTSKLTIDTNMLSEYYIRYFPIEEQNRFVSRHLNEYNIQKANLERLKKELSDRLKGILED